MTALSTFSVFTGELRDPKLEGAFLDEAWWRNAWQLRLLFGAGAIGGVLMILANLSDPALEGVIVPMVASRVVQTSFFLAGALWTFKTRRPALIMYLVALAELATVATEMVNLTLALGPQIQDGKSAGTPFVVVLTFLFYTLVPNRFSLTAAICLGLMVADSITIYFVMGGNASIAGYVFIQLLFVNIIGFSYGRYINRLQRQDYVSRLNLEEELVKRREAERAAEISSDQKSKFIAVAGHDLRQPLFALGLWVDALQGRPQGSDDKVSDYLTGKIVHAKDNLGELLNRLLHVAHLDSGITDVQSEAIAVQGIFDDLEVRFGPAAARRRQLLTVIPCGLTVRSDRTLLNRILDNLVDNAIKYGIDGGRVTIGVRRQGALVRFEVWNDGDGIPGNQIDLIFDEYHQIDTTRRSLRGLGLGLSIVKRLADLLDHSLTVRSTPGQLTVFAVVVPRSDQQSETRPDQVSAPSQIPATILVLEDDTEIGEAISLSLSNWGASVLVCSNRADALEAAKTTRPDVILSDLDLGDDDGIEVVATLRRQLGIDVPVILMTGDTTTEALRRANASGFTFLSKPVDAQELRETLARHR